MSVKTFAVKSGLTGVVVLVLFVLCLNMYKIVEDGTVSTGKLFGEVQSDVYGAGLHFPINPLVDFTTFDIKENMFQLDDVSIPSQDKFKSSADVSVQWSIDPAHVVTLQKTFGDQTMIRNKILVEPLLSILREAGRMVPKAQDLFQADVQNKVQDYVQTELSANATKYGVKVNAVYIKDITLPPVIVSAITTTKQLEEKEAQEQANLNQQKLVYQRQVEEAKANAESARAQEQARQAAADAAAYEVRTAADASLYSAQKEAESNIALGASVNSQLIKLKELEIDMQKAKSWQGGVPQTVMGDAANALPLFHVNKGQ